MILSTLIDKQKILEYILLDVHGVLTDGNERKRFLSQMKNKYDMDYDQHNSLWVKHIGNLDKKIVKPSDYIKVVNKTFHTNFTVNEYYEFFLKQIKVNEILMKKLNETEIKVCIVSDTLFPISSGLNKIFGRQFQAYKKFYSFQLGVTKAEGMLDIVIKRLSIRPEKCLFIDDNSRNIEVARELGIHALLFKTNKELFNSLKNVII